MPRKVKPFQAVVGKVKQTGPDQWNVYLDDGAACDTWLTVYREDFGDEPHAGDILTIVPPHCIGRFRSTELEA